MRFLTFDLFESIAQAKTILQDLGVDNSDTAYQKILGMLKKKPGYVGSFVKWHYIDNIPLADLENLNKLLNHVKLDIPIQEFRSINDLQEYLINKKLEQDTNQVIKVLPKFQQNLINDDIRELIKDYLNYKEEIKQFFREKSSAFKTTEELYFATWDLVRKFKYAHNRAQILSLIREVGAKLIHEDNSVIIVQTLTHQQMCQLGPTNWCIVRNVSDWQEWTQNDKRQFIIWDLTKSKNDNDSILGITLDRYGNPAGAYQKNDLSYDPKVIMQKWGHYFQKPN